MDIDVDILFVKEKTLEALRFASTGPRGIFSYSNSSLSSLSSPQFSHDEHLFHFRKKEHCVLVLH